MSMRPPQIVAFGGKEGKLSHPLAFTKSFAMCGVALLAITLVPALIPLLIRGQLSGEEDNPIVRSFINSARSKRPASAQAL